MTGLSAAEVMALIQRQVPDMVRRAVSQPVKRFGTVQSLDSGGLKAIVLVDGDSQPIEVVNAAGQIEAGFRVVVDFYPPHGAICSGRLGADAPWDTAWGILRWQQETIDYGPTALSGNSDFLLTDVEARDDRSYEVVLQSNFVLSASALWDVYLSVDGTRTARFGVFDKAYTLGNVRNGTVLWQPAASGSYDLRVSHQEFTGTASLTYSADANNPRAFWVKDIGPRVAEG